MNTLEQALRHITRALDDRGLPWALVGGLAVSARAEPRTTRDIDIAVAVDSDAEAEALVLSLRANGFVPVALVEHTAKKRLATARLQVEGSGILVDLLFASSGVEDEIARLAEPIEIIPGLVVPVARKAHLIALKILARDDRNRPQDWDDLRALERGLLPQELEEVRRALSIITTRGYDRHRDLHEALNRFLDERSNEGA